MKKLIALMLVLFITAPTFAASFQKFVENYKSNELAFKEKNQWETFEFEFIYKETELDSIKEGKDYDERESGNYVITIARWYGWAKFIFRDKTDIIKIQPKQKIKIIGMFADKEMFSFVFTNCELID